MFTMCKSRGGVRLRAAKIISKHETRINMFFECGSEYLSREKVYSHPLGGCGTNQFFASATKICRLEVRVHTILSYTMPYSTVPTQQRTTDIPFPHELLGNRGNARSV